MKRQLHIATLPVTFADSGTGDTCVLVHGAGANRNYWTALVRDLPHLRTIVPDLYGHGETPPWRDGPPPRGDYTYGDDVDLLARIVDQIAGPFALVGHSSGGAVCLEYTRLHGDRVTRLVVAEPMLPTLLAGRFPAEYVEVSSAYGRAHDAVARGELEAAAKCLFEYILGDGEWVKLASGTRQWMTQNVAITLAAHSRASLALTVAPDRYAAIRCPVLVLCGENTRAPFRTICRTLAAALPDARHVVIGGASHNAPVTHAQQVNGEIVRFLGEQQPPSSGAAGPRDAERGRRT